ncbi:MAG: hypothetical protein ACYTE8_10305 [Planctomycetota bacterium]|jgi:hypothetical protein
MCTEKQKRCIFAVSKKLGIKVDNDKIAEMSTKEASAYIDELTSQQEKPSDTPNTEESNINDPRLGMCFKLVYRTAEPGYWSEHKEEFMREVVNAYKLAEEAEEAVESALSLNRADARK